jgi:glycine hydroxymethyltransferase
VTSGIRVGTPAVTTRGFGTAEVTELAHWMCEVMDNLQDDKIIQDTRNKVLDICKKYPVYG